jgi:ABC-2 type transport system ATP-binding protein
MTVKEQLLYYGALKGMDETEIIKRMKKLLKEFEIEEYENRKIKELSKGNQQKIQFISAVINNPKLLILDEPFTGLDPINVAMFKKYIRLLQSNGCSIIFSSHQMEHIEEFCEKLVILVKGKSILEGYISDIKKAYRKQNIFIKGNIDVSEIEKINGVIEVIKISDEYMVKIENEDIVSKVFKKISNFNITKFLVEEASLNEIFIDKVGEFKC